MLHTMWVMREVGVINTVVGTARVNDVRRVWQPCEHTWITECGLLGQDRALLWSGPEETTQWPIR